MRFTGWGVCVCIRTCGRGAVGDGDFGHQAQTTYRHRDTIHSWHFPAEVDVRDPVVSRVVRVAEVALFPGGREGTQQPRPQAAIEDLPFARLHRFQAESGGAWIVDQLALAYGEVLCHVFGMQLVTIVKYGHD